MILAPESVEELAGQIAAAREPVGRVDLSRMREILEHAPEDMTATVQCGATLEEFQRSLARSGQWVPLDPARADRTTIGDMLAHDLSGPRRFGYGTVREYVIGMRVVLGTGETIRNGGKVVKNVAGYDLCRLFIGARNTLGIIVEATFKLRPVPEAETIVRRPCASLEEARRLSGPLLKDRRLSGMAALDLHETGGGLTLVAAFAGAREDVLAQSALAREAGLSEPGNFQYNEATHGLGKHSVLPNRVFNELERLNGARFVARIGNGIIYHTGERGPTAMPEVLMARIKAAYDPRNIFPGYRA